MPTFDQYSVESKIKKLFNKLLSRYIFVFGLHITKLRSHEGGTREAHVPQIACLFYIVKLRNTQFYAL